MKVYIGMDVHLNSFSLCSYSPEDDRTFFRMKTGPSAEEVGKYVGSVISLKGEDTEILCGYEAGCMGYPLQKELEKAGIDCVILAPSTMPRYRKEIKTDKRDAEKIAKCLAHHTCSYVAVPDDRDLEVRDFLRMREDHKAAFVKVKQQILSFLMRNGYRYGDGDTWTKKHLKWLRNLEMPPFRKQILEEYLITYDYYDIRIRDMEKELEKIAEEERYREKVKRLVCIKGIRTLSALSLIVETGDFRRFPDASSYSAYIGLVPGENSSGEKQKRTGITKSGNRYLRTILTEAAQCYGRNVLSHEKSKELIKRQEGAPSEAIRYADRAADRISKKFFRILYRSDRNTAVTAAARELSCFVWGMMTDHLD